MSAYLIAGVHVADVGESGKHTSVTPGGISCCSGTSKPNTLAAMAFWPPRKGADRCLPLPQRGLGALVLAFFAASAVLGAEPDWRVPWQGARGWGAVYILARRGPLTVEIGKRDLNIYEGADVLVARLVGPDRQLLQEARLEDDGRTDKGGRGPQQTCEMRVQVAAPGVCKLDIESHARGSDLAWGVRTSAPHVFDCRALFKQPELGGDVWFEAPAGEVPVRFDPQAVAQTITLLDAREAPLATFPLEKAPVVTHAIPAADSKRVLGFRIQKKQLGWRIDGVTDFAGDAAQGPFPDSHFWASRRDAWFDIRRVRHCLFPRRRRLFRRPGEAFRAAFTVRNPGPELAGLTVSADAPGIPELRLDPPAGTLQLATGEMREVVITGQLPASMEAGQSVAARLRVSCGDMPELSVYATLTLAAGTAPAKQTFAMPLVLQPYAHANALLGYEPDYVPNAPYFDLDNRPTIRWRGYHRHLSDAIEVLDDSGTWRHAEFMTALRAAVPGLKGLYFPTYALGVKTAFAGSGAYTLVSAITEEGRQTVLLHSADGLRSYRAIPFGPIGKVGFEIEQFTGHNGNNAYPPPIMLTGQTRDHQDRWASYHDLLLYLPERTAEGTIDPGEPLKISSRCIAFAPHSGGASAIAALGEKVHIVWGETVDESKSVPGVPTYVATYDRATRKLGEPVLVAHGPPVNDVHNSPGIVLDGKEFLHVVTGAHGAPFYYSHSLEPDSAYGGWSEPVPVLTSGRKSAKTDADGDGAQTYLGLVCTPDGTLHIVSRQWRANVDPYHAGRLYAALAYQRKRPGSDWEQARPLVVPPLPDYSVWYHKLGLDRRGTLFVDHVYYSVHPTYNNDLPGRLDYPVLMMSPDGGDTWKLAETEDFLEGMRRN